MYNVQVNHLKIELPNEKPSMRDIFRALPFLLRFYYRAQGNAFILHMFGVLGQAPALALQVYAMKIIGDALIVQDTKLFYTGLVYMGICAVAFACTDYAETVGSDLSRYRTEYAIRYQGMNIMAHLPFAILEDSGFQRLRFAYQSKISDISHLQDAMFMFLYNVASFIGYGAIFIFLPWPVILMFCIIFAIRILNAKREAQWTWSIFGKETREGRRSDYIERIFMDAKQSMSVKSWGLHIPFVRMWKKITNTILNEYEKKSWVMGSSVALTVFLQITGAIIGLYFLFHSFILKQITAGVVLVFFTNYLSVSRSFGNMFYNIREMSKALPFIVMFKQYLSSPLESDVGVRVSREPIHIQFDQVSFRYPGTHTDILKNVHFQFSEGDHIALIGLNGAGKSTVLKLLMGVYEPTQGQILINGIALQKIKPSAWRRVLAVLGQDQLFFDDTFKNQIVYSDQTSTINSAGYRRALSVSGFGSISKDFSRGMDTHAGKRFSMPEDEAVELSGGQNQILGIARTLYRDARIYIFDEPTSAVDALKEEKFFEALPEAFQSKGILFVSHRFSTLRRAKRILVLDGGRIIEDGTHEELLFKAGRYAELFTLQAKMYT